MTSNIGSAYLLEGINQQGEISDKARDEVMDLLHRQFKPEFLNRIDEIVLFKPLKKDEIIRILDIALGEIGKRLEDRNITMEVSREAKALIAEKSYSPTFGARPVKRYMQKNIETVLGKLIISGALNDGMSIRVGVKGQELDFEIK